MQPGGKKKGKKKTKLTHQKHQTAYKHIIHDKGHLKIVGRARSGSL